jgi:hypothetical protein
MTTTFEAGSKVRSIFEHAVTVGATAGLNHGYPYRAVCSCGWRSNTYAAEHAAQTMGDDHLDAELTLSVGAR